MEWLSRDNKVNYSFVTWEEEQNDLALLVPQAIADQDAIATYVEDDTDLRYERFLKELEGRKKDTEDDKLAAACLDAKIAHLQEMKDLAHTEDHGDMRDASVKL